MRTDRNSIPLCKPCHQEKDGWHGTRLRWKLRHIDENDALNKTIEVIFAKSGELK